MKKATSPQSRLSTHPASLKLCKVYSSFDNTLARNGFYSLPLAQGLRTLHSVAHACYACFFVPCSQFLMGRGGTGQYKSDLFVKSVRRSMAVLNTPIALRGNQLRKLIGGIHHA